jgi:hypothetical protein
MEQKATIVERLIAHWRDQGLEPRPPCATAEVDGFEMREHVVLPEDLRRYWLSADGMREENNQSQDSEGFSFWPLRRVIRVDKEMERRSPHTPLPVDSSAYYVFADYLDWSWAYAVKLRSSEAGKVILVGAQAISLVADSFSEFVETYLSDGRALYPAT